jgi:hypothetical protein
MIDLENGDVAKLCHPPRASVEPSAQNDELRGTGGPYRIVHGHGASDHHLRALVEECALDTTSQAFRACFCAEVLDLLPGVARQ